MSGESVDRKHPHTWSGEQGNEERPYGGQPYPYDGLDVEGGKSEFGFNDASIRAGFVRKVFTIVAIMCLVVILMTTPVVINDDLRIMMQQNKGIYFIAILVFFTSYCALVCCSSLARMFPCNLMILAIFTIAAGFMLMVLCSMVPPITVLMALVTTTVCCAAIILFASQTTIDITSCMFLVFAASMAVFIFGIVVAILSLFIYIKTLHLLYSAVACVLFMVYLAMDIQLIIGGKRYEISPEDYVFAALMLFVDIYEIFILLLNIMVQANE